MATLTARKLKLMATSTLVLAILFTLALIASAASWTPADPGYDLEFARSNEGILPEFVEGNSPNSLAGFMAIKQDYNEDGFVFSGDDPLRFDFYPDDEDMSKQFSVWLFKDDNDVIYIHHWEATNLVVHHVLVKGGPNFFAYNYDGSLMEDGSLYSPRVGNDDQNVADISHFTAFVTDIPEETTTEETTTEETTTEETTTAEETTAEETTTEETTTAEETTAEETTTVAETLEETTAETITLTQETVPQATEPTTEEPEETTIVLTPEEIPQTGQGATSLIVGLVLLGLATSMGLLLRKVRKNEQ